MKLDRRLANPQDDYPVNLTVIAQRHSQVFLCVTSVSPLCLPEVTCFAQQTTSDILPDARRSARMCNGR